MPKAVLSPPPVRVAGARDLDPIDAEIAATLRAERALSTTERLRQIRGGAPAVTAASPVHEPLSESAKAMAALTNTVTTASTGLVESYKGQAQVLQATAQAEAERRREVEEAAEARVRAAAEAEERKGTQLIEILTNHQQNTLQMWSQMSDSKAQAAVAEVKTEVARLEERLEYERRVAEDRERYWREKYEEAMGMIQNRPASFQEQLFGVLIRHYGDGDLAKALPALLGTQTQMSPDDRIKNAQADWYESTLQADAESRRNESQGKKKMMEDVGEAAKTVGSQIAQLGQQFLGGMGLPSAGQPGNLLPPEPPAPPAPPMMEDLADAS